MYKIKYGYCYQKWDDYYCRFEDTGPMYEKQVTGHTIKELNDKFYAIRMNHDMYKYSPIQFISIEEY